VKERAFGTKTSSSGKEGKKLTEGKSRLIATERKKGGAFKEDSRKKREKTCNTSIEGEKEGKNATQEGVAVNGEGRGSRERSPNATPKEGRLEGEGKKKKTGSSCFYARKVAAIPPKRKKRRNASTTMKEGLSRKEEKRRGGKRLRRGSLLNEKRGGNWPFSHLVPEEKRKGKKRKISAFEKRKKKGGVPAVSV